MEGCLTGRRIDLVSGCLLNISQQESIFKIFLGPSAYPIRQQVWSSEDLRYFLRDRNYFWAIVQKNHKSIGYTLIAEDDDCFELALHKDFQGRGYSIDATLLAVHHYFQFKKHCKKINTRIFIHNSNSKTAAHKFGWVTELINGEWEYLSLHRKSFYNNLRLINLIKRLAISPFEEL